MTDPPPIQEVTPDAAFDLLKTRPDGLTSSEVQQRLRTYGPNLLRSVPRLWWVGRLIRQLLNFFTLLLVVAAAICLLAERLQPGQGMGTLGWVLAGVALINALFSFLQEFRAERAMQALVRLLPNRVLVRRGGDEVELSADQVVPGDVIVLHEGDRVPADARVTVCEGLAVNNAPLTGEAQPIALTSEPQDVPATDARNLVFAGCSVVAGRGEAIVTATASGTEFGKIATLSHETRRAQSPLQRETAHMVRVLTVIACVMGVSFFIYGVATGHSLWLSLVFMMGIIVANVPEGLLPTFTLSLAVASRRMAKRNVLVKSLNAVEALGAVHVICTDKTGSLTENRLVVADTFVPGSATNDHDPASQAALFEYALIASEIERVEQGFGGDPLDVAIAKRLAESEQQRIDSALSRVTRRFAFDPMRRRSAGLATREDRSVFVVKGAWESLRGMIGGHEAQNDQNIAAIMKQADEQVHRLASEGRRVIAVAHRVLEQAPDQAASQADLEHGLTLDGLIALEDPVRAEVPDAVARCHAAGIRVVMITGDHPDTALAVARFTGIIKKDNSSDAITGEELATLSDQDLIACLRDGLNVFARTTPRQKLRIVRALQKMDLVVAVTGDGVNDAPALKAADVGVAMGIAGTDVARESAQVILLDDNFASIVAGVEEGRTIYDNIRKFTNYVLVSNGPEIIPYLLYILLPVPLALTVAQILAIDLGTDIVPSMALGREPTDPESMKRPPRSKDAALLTPRLLLHSYGFLGLIEAAYAMTLFFLVLQAGGWHYGQAIADDDPLYRSATGITLASIMLMQIGNLLGRRSRTRLGVDRGVLCNRLMLLGIAIELALSWAVLYCPPVCRVLGTGPVQPGFYLLACLGAPLILLLDYARKRIAGSYFKPVDRLDTLNPKAEVDRDE